LRKLVLHTCNAADKPTDASYFLSHRSDFPFPVNNRAIFRLFC
jgi:hypothetical protein